MHLCFQVQNLLEDISTFVEEKLYKRSVFTIISLVVDKSIEQSEHELVQNSDPFIVIPVILLSQFGFESLESNLHILVSNVPIAADNRTDFPSFLNARNFSFEHVPVVFHVRFNWQDNQ